jgi:acetoin:2,6-dichlorophenolindophenol oxidoreductase subunit beta
MADVTVYWHTPGLKIVIPSNPRDTKGLLKTAIRDNNPVIFCTHEKLMDIKGEVPDEEYTIPFGVAEIKRQGTDITVVATSHMVTLSLAAAEELKKTKNISIEVIDPRTLEPFDIDTVVASVCSAST